MLFGELRTKYTPWVEVKQRNCNAKNRNDSPVVVIITRFKKARLPSEIELHMASGQGSLGHTIIYEYYALFPSHVFVDLLFLNTPTWVDEYSVKVFLSKCMFTNPILHICQSDCLYRSHIYMFSHSALDLAVITRNIFKFSIRKCVRNLTCLV